MDPGVFEIATVIGSIAGFIVTIMLGRALARRIGGHRPSDQVGEVLADLQHRVASLEQDVERMGELEERVDFAERILSEVRESPQGLPRNGEAVAGERTDP